MLSSFSGDRAEVDRNGGEEDESRDAERVAGAAATSLPLLAFMVVCTARAVSFKFELTSRLSRRLRNGEDDVSRDAERVMVGAAPSAPSFASMIVCTGRANFTFELSPRLSQRLRSLKRSSS